MKKFAVFLLALACMVGLCSCGGKAGPGRPVAPVIGDYVTEVAVTHIISGHQEKCTVTDRDEISLLSQWAENLEYEHMEFDDGQSPGDSDGGEVYSFVLTPNEHEGGYPGFSYVINGLDSCWLLIEGYWFSVKNPSYPPVNGPEIFTGGRTSKEGGRVEEIYYSAPSLCLEALKSLVELRGEALDWSDFALYKSEDIGSGLYILRYPIDDTLCLLIGGGSPDSPPMYIRLAVVDADGFITDDYIDVRTESIDDFLTKIGR